MNHFYGNNFDDSVNNNALPPIQKGEFSANCGRAVPVSEFNFWKTKSEFYLPWEDFGTEIVERACQGVTDDNFSDNLISNYSSSDENNDNFFSNPNSSDFVPKGIKSILKSNSIHTQYINY
ncbi:hypothetical protein AYI70_g9622 [Smittium culicis]|uniref:Uncharacterized protein n=1 Tax=Smittium culicis TaxID=133412 RepID=A0A1R1XAE9_9FUNG|nr:hypothetical protein AYI70_g9622 [Smittium culicis]